MSPRRGLPPAFRRYLLLEAPTWVLAAVLLAFAVETFGLSSPLALLLLALWIGKDFALYPWLRRAYEKGDPGATAVLVGQIGEARERLARSGYVRLASELWRAEVPDEHGPVEAGEPVRVRAVRGLTLVVEPLQGARSAGASREAPRRHGPPGPPRPPSAEGPGSSRSSLYGLSSPSRIA